MARKKKVEEPVEEIIQEEVAAEEAPVEEELLVERGRWVETVGPHGRYMIFVKDK